MYKEVPNPPPKINSQSSGYNNNNLVKNTAAAKPIASYPEEQYNLVKVRGDGYCMINSVLVGLNQILPNSVSKPEVLKKIKPTFLADIENYISKIESCTTDPIKELDEYVAFGKYTSPVTDIIFPIISNALHIEIQVLTHNEDSQCFELRSDILI